MQHKASNAHIHLPHIDDAVLIFPPPITPAPPRPQHPTHISTHPTHSIKGLFSSFVRLSHLHPLQITAWNRSASYCLIFPSRLSTHSVRVLHRPAPNLQFLLPSHLVSFILFHASICHLFPLRRCLLILPPYQRMSEVPSDSERISALQTRRVAFYEEVSRRIDLMGTNSGILMDTTYNEIVEFINAIKECAANDERRQIMPDNAARNPYRLLEKYDLIVNSDSTKILIFKQRGGSALDSCQIVVKFSSIFDVVRQIHEVEAGNDHPKSKTLHKRVSAKYGKSIPCWICELFPDFCSICVRARRRSKPKAGHQPILTRGMNVRVQLDIIDYQSMPDGPFKYVLDYQDHGTKLCQLHRHLSRYFVFLVLHLFFRLTMEENSVTQHQSHDVCR